MMEETRGLLGRQSPGHQGILFNENRDRNESETVHFNESPAIATTSEERESCSRFTGDGVQGARLKCRSGPPGDPAAQRQELCVRSCLHSDQCSVRSWAAGFPLLFLSCWRKR